jgi:murein DD-endopeptidase MepM/ murein hydrolase activator NlpD
MRKVVLFLMFGFSTVTYGLEPGVLTRSAQKSFLSAQKFPTVYQDLSFVDRMANETAGYDRFSTLSAYDQLELEDLHEYLARQISEEVSDEGKTDVVESNINDMPTQSVVQPSITRSPVHSSDSLQRGYCVIRHPNIPSGQKIPFGAPVLHEHFVYCAPYAMVNRGKGNRVHQGYDIGCTLESFGRPIFVTADGVVSLIKKNRRGSSAGNYIIIDHENGFKTYYMHLDQVLVNQGQRVSAGCQIATIGNTGASLETKNKSNSDPHFSKSLSHLHYEMTYTGSQTYVSTNGKTLAITHGWPNSKTKSTRETIDPTQFICVYANFKTGYCGKKFPYL